LTLAFRLLAVWLLLGVVALAQHLPVEIELVPPPSDLYEAQPVEPYWKAPPVICPLCGEDKSDGSCGCQRPLTQELGDTLYAQLGGLVDLAFHGKLALARPVRLRVVPAEHLRRLGGEPLLGLYEEGVIYLSQDLRRREGLAVMAHEYGHAWQYQSRQDIDRVEGLLFEGFAEWVSFHVLAQVGDTQGTDEVLRDPSIYGEGARWFLKLEKKVGLDKALESARFKLRS
jgi:hypothetical protein